MGKHKTDESQNKPMNPKTGLIDALSIKEYRSAYSQHQAKYGDAQANPQLDEHITTRIHQTVDKQKKKRKRDITSVAMSSAAGTMVPFSGIPIMVATTVVQCIGFSASLGMIPIANMRSLEDANTLASQLTQTLNKASTSGVKAAIEAFVWEILQQAGLGSWIWEEILKDIVFELTSGVVTEAAWVITPLFAAPKYYLHRKLIKKMYISLGEKAIVVHKAWVNDHLFLGKPEPENENYSTAAEWNSAPMATGAPVSQSGFPSAYSSGYPPHGQTQYESNSNSTNPQPYPSYPPLAILGHSHSAPPHGISVVGGSVVGGGFPMPYPSATQMPQQTMSYEPPPPAGNSGHYQHLPPAAPQSYPPPQFPPAATQQNPKQRLAEPG